MLSDLVLAATVGYLLGALPTGVIIAKRVKGIDPRQYGSGSTGFTNTLRLTGWIPALVVATIDVGKGAAAVLLAKDLFDSGHLAGAVAGVGAVIGHIWPVYVGFKGGRGVATGFGALLALVPSAALAVLPPGLLVAAVSRYMSLMSLIGSCLAPAFVLVLALLGYTDSVDILFGTFAAALIIYQHRGNIQRLRAGTEPKIGQGGTRRAGSFRRGA